MAIEDQSSLEGERLRSLGHSPIAVPPALVSDVHKDRVFRGLGLARPSVRRCLGRYTVLEVLGQGGMGIVMRAYDGELDRAVAVKLLHPGSTEQDDRRLRREAQALAKLSHPNVVQVYEVGRAEGQMFIAMEFVRGQTLAQWASGAPRPSWRQCVQVYLQAGAGLAAAHAQGLVHRDFKPSNAIIDDAGQVRVLDFGLVRRERGGAEVESTAELDPEVSDGALQEPLTRTGGVMGTPAYMPLEQVEGRLADAASDQFSFCVSLWEALYGQRPFAGRSIEELRAEMALDHVAPAPRDAGVPPRLREVLLRGLAREPEARWPSLAVLLEQLERQLAPRRRGWIGLGVGLLGGVAMVGAALVHRAEAEVRCTGARAQLEGIWDGERRSEIQQSIVGTSLPHAVDTWARVDVTLGDYAEAWVAEHADACAATTVRQEQTEHEMSLRMGCLRERKVALRAMAEVLGDADSEVVEKAVGMVMDLPRLDHCDDVEQLRRQRQRVPPPSEPGVVREVEVLRERLAEVEALRSAGRYERALEEVEPVLRRARVLGYMPLVAEARQERGLLRVEHGQYDDAEADLLGAYELAARHDHERVELESANVLTYLVGGRQRRYSEGLLWGRVALALAERIGETPLDEAEVLHNLGVVHYYRGDYQEAQSAFEQAVETQTALLGEGHPKLAKSMSNLGNLLREQGEYQEAEDLLERALSMLERALGQHHPALQRGMNLLGVVHLQQGHHEAAAYQFRRAIRIGEAALGEEHPFVATALNNLGSALAGQGEHEQAQASYQRALEIWTSTLGSEHLHVAGAMGNLASNLLDQAKYDEAEPYYRRALKVIVSTADAEHPDMMGIYSGLARIALARGDGDAAIENAERAVSLGEHNAAPPDLAEARFVLARALWPTSASRARALALRARDAYAGAGEPHQHDLAKIEEWLAAHAEPPVH